jgi:uncharacterized protein (TIGR02444 family)
MTPLWDFAVAVYGAPGVREAVLELQDAHDVDVPLLLAVAWLAARGVPVDAGRRAALAALTRPWQGEVVAPLRRARRALRERASAPAALGLDDGARAEFKREVQALELAAERYELDAVATHAAPWAPAVDAPDLADALAACVPASARDRLAPLVAAARAQGAG